MNQYVTGAVIRQLREQQGLTQAELANLLSVSDKTVSKWETGRGYPDIALLSPLAKAFQVSVTELLAGQPVTNANISANMLRSRFYVCPVCGNVIHSMGEAAITCHGVLLSPCLAEPADAHHAVQIEPVEDEYFVTINHEMTKTHYISFIAAVSPDRIQLVKLYPEGNAQTRIKPSGIRKLLFFCNQDGLFTLDIKRPKTR
ncbi:MAG: helix-turn-helix domain-containing protein [Clostridia bacterium]|nr:helix-turn-helix domain-containing protein [Clostridia bacterium]